MLSDSLLQLICGFLPQILKKISIFCWQKTPVADRIAVELKQFYQLASLGVR